MLTIDRQHWLAELAEFSDLNLWRSFTPHDQRFDVPNTDEMARIMARMGKFTPHDELNCGACGYHMLAKFTARQGGAPAGTRAAFPTARAWSKMDSSAR
jgi:hypothetical protein